MKARNWGLIAATLVALGLRTPAATLYVNLNNAAPAAPYSSWSTAATNIQDAIDAASAGDTVMVTNGVYNSGGHPVPSFALTNRVCATNPLVIQSVNGPKVTVIEGQPDPRVFGIAVRCCYLTDGASLIGFTLTNGSTADIGHATNDQIGGGIWCASTNSTVSNCVIVGNVADLVAGGVYGGSVIRLTSGWVVERG